MSLYTLPSVQSWLGHELEVRGIDAMIYTRYILSILQQDNLDVERELQQSPSRKEIHAGRPKGKSQRRPRSVDVEELKKTTVVECLQSVADQECDIENLVDELCTRLKSLQAEQSAGNSLVPSHRDLHSCDSDSECLDSPDNEAEGYYEAFPALSDKTNLMPPEPKPWGSSWASRCRGDSSADKSPERNDGSKLPRESLNNNNKQSRKSKSASMSRNSTTPTRRHQRKYSLPENTLVLPKSPGPSQRAGCQKAKTSRESIRRGNDKVPGKEAGSARQGNPDVTAGTGVEEMGKRIGKNGTFEGLFVPSTQEDLKWYTDPMGDIFTPTTTKSKLQTLYKLSEADIAAKVEEDLSDTAQALVESLCQEAISEAMKSEHVLAQFQDAKASVVEEPSTKDVEGETSSSQEPFMVENVVEKVAEDAVKSPDSTPWNVPDRETAGNAEMLVGNLESCVATAEDKLLTESVRDNDCKRSDTETSPTVEDLFGAFRVNLAAIWDDRSPDISSSEPTWTSPIPTECEQSQQSESQLPYSCFDSSVECFTDDGTSVGYLKSPIEKLQYQESGSRDTSVISSPDSDFKLSDARNAGMDGVWSSQTPSLYEKPQVHVLDSEEILNESDFQRTLNIDASWHCINANTSPFNQTTNTQRDSTDSSVWDVNSALWSTYDLEPSWIQPPKFVTTNNNNNYKSDVDADLLQQQQTGFIPGGVYGNISLQASAQLNVESNQRSQSSSPAAAGGGDDDSKEIWESGCVGRHFPPSSRNSSRFVFAQERSQPELEEVQSFDFGNRTTSRFHFAQGCTPVDGDCREGRGQTAEEPGSGEQEPLGDVCLPFDDGEVLDLSALEKIGELHTLALQETLEMEPCNGQEHEYDESFLIDSEKDKVSYPHQSATFTYHKGAFTKIIPKSRTEPIIAGSSWSGPIGRGRAFGPFQFADGAHGSFSKQMLAWENLLISPKTHFKPIKESFSSESPFECEDQHGGSAKNSYADAQQHHGLADIYGGFGPRFAHSAPDSAGCRPDPKLKYFLSQYTQRWSTGSDDAEIVTYTSHMPMSEIKKHVGICSEAAAVTDGGSIRVPKHKAGETTTKGSVVVKQASIGGLFGVDQDTSLPEDTESHLFKIQDNMECAALPMEHEDHMFPFEGDVTTLDGSFDANQMVFSFDLEREWMKATHPDIYKRKKPKKGYSKKPCSFYLEGSCHRADCKFAHDLTNITCRFWEEGSCFKGMDCPFLHGYPSEQITPCDSQDGSKPNSFTLDTDNFPELPKSSTDKSSSSNESTPPGTLRRRGKGVPIKNGKKAPVLSSKLGGTQHKKSLPININYKK